MERYRSTWGVSPRLAPQLPAEFRLSDRPLRRKITRLALDITEFVEADGEIA
jgi:hypothetical protein